MIAKRRITIDLQCTSACSEAALFNHTKYIAELIESNAKQHTDHSWLKSVNMSWDESYAVDIEITTTDQEII